LETATGYGAKLYGIDFGNEIDFSECRLLSAQISDCRFYNTNLINVSLHAAKIEDTSFKKSNLRRSSLIHADICSVNFSNADLYKVSFQESKINDIVLENANLTKISFDAVDLSEMKFSRLDFNNANFNGVDFTDCVLASVNFTHADLSGSKLHRTDFGGSNLSGVDFRGADIHETHFGGTELIGANFYDLDVRSAGFGGATMEEIILESSEMQGLDLSNRDLSGANLKNANLTDTNLRGTDLQGADLEGAVVENTDLREADLTDAKTYQTYFHNIRLNRETILSDPCVYDKNNEYQKAIRVYREYQQILKNNSLPDSARRFRVLEKHTKKDQCTSFWTKKGKQISSAIWLYGESWKRVLATTVLVISSYSIFYTYLGIGRAERLPDSLTIFEMNIGIPDLIETFLTGLYFSILTFSTMGYGDLQPSGFIMKFLAGSEALLGGLLLAALVFVLGRRATW
jgi:uncharacterized protein YjbI with pentapeptide repeats